MHREAEDTSTPGDISDGLDNKWGGGLAARVDHRPHLHDRLAAGCIHVEVDNMDMTSTPHGTALDPCQQARLKNVGFT
jgi:hypothetical protein